MNNGTRAHGLAVQYSTLQSVCLGDLGVLSRVVSRVLCW